MMFVSTRRGSFIICVIISALVSSCSVYDEVLLDTESLTGSASGARGSDSGTQIVSGGSGGNSVTGGTSGSGNSGSGGGTGSEEFPFNEPVDADSSVAGDAKVGDSCGDGRVTGSEKCDIGIAAGQPGACASDCPPPNGCVRWQLVGSTCETECELYTPTCEDGDNCCPEQCTNADDSDCSASCGDGIVQADQGETCEPRSALVDNPEVDALACPTQCEDDGDPCTTEMLTGSEDNCNSICSTVEIASIAEGDGCCPDGANANTDGDCAPICGNQVREGDEECDGAESCDDQCKTTLTPEQLTCMEVDTIGKDECKKCTCANCANETIQCLSSGDAAVDEQCAILLECGERTGCVGAYCYCGSALVPWTQTCLIGDPDGPCKTELEHAAEQATGLSDIFTIFFLQADANGAIGRAFNFSLCYQTNCINICESAP